MESGALSVMTCGTLEMPVLFANSLIMEEVSLSRKLYILKISAFSFTFFFQCPIHCWDTILIMHRHIYWTKLTALVLRETSVSAIAEVLKHMTVKREKEQESYAQVT